VRTGGSWIWPVVLVVLPERCRRRLRVFLGEGAEKPSGEALAIVLVGCIEGKLLEAHTHRRWYGSSSEGEARSCFENV
jgi:hypothetical protein